MLPYAYYINCRKHQCAVAAVMSAQSLGLGAKKSKFGQQGGAEVGRAYVIHDSFIMGHETPVNQDRNDS